MAEWVLFTYCCNVAESYGLRMSAWVGDFDRQPVFCGACK